MSSSQVTTALVAELRRKGWASQNFEFLGTVLDGARDDCATQVASAGACTHKGVADATRHRRCLPRAGRDFPWSPPHSGRMTPLTHSVLIEIRGGSIAFREKGGKFGEIC